MEKAKGSHQWKNKYFENFFQKGEGSPEIPSCKGTKISDNRGLRLKILLYRLNHVQTKSRLLFNVTNFLLDYLNYLKGTF